MTSNGINPKLCWQGAFIALLALGGFGTCYFAWCWQRISSKVLMHDAHWPRPAPYPDNSLMELNDWFDRRYPAPPGTLKIHGELMRVRLTIIGCIAFSLALFAVGVYPFVRAGFPMVARRPGNGQ